MRLSRDHLLVVTFVKPPIDPIRQVRLGGQTLGHKENDPIAIKRYLIVWIAV